MPPVYKRNEATEEKKLRRKKREKAYAVSIQNYVFVVTRRRVSVCLFRRLQFWLFILSPFIYTSRVGTLAEFIFYLFIRRVAMCVSVRASYVTRHSIVHDDQNKRVHSRFVNNV